MISSDTRFMTRALELANLGLGNVSPNPMVGCVVVHDDKIIGEGYHKKYGEAHAEVNAIASVKNQDLLKESTVYVTLEPCAHHGKTPPCADLLVEKGVKKVVIGIEDPFAKVNGKGIEKLEKAGIEVERSGLRDQALKLNKRFFTFHQKKRPYVILKWAETLDGFIARTNFDSKWISNEYSRQLVHKWRAEEDAILVGKGTAIYDNPSLTVRTWQGTNPVRVLLDGRLDVKPTHKIFNEDAKTIIFNLVKEEKAEASHWIKSEDLHPKAILNHLYEVGIHSMIIEGGASVLNSFIEENCWDEARIFVSTQSFKEGIKAPSINGELLSTKTIFEDTLRIVENYG